MRQSSWVLVLAGCGRAAPPADTGDGLYLAPPESGVQLHFGPVEVAAYTEEYYCLITRLPNETELPIVRLEHLASPVAHHFNVWGLILAPDEDVLGDCDTVWSETSMAVSAPLYASQDPSFAGDFPEGVAGLLPAEQAVLLEFHAINPTGEAVQAEAWLNATAGDPDEIEVYANGLYGSNSDLELPPGEERTFTRDCVVDVDMEVFVLGSHFHRLGTRFEIWTIDADRQPIDLVYENEDWSSPELRFYSDAPLPIAAGEGFRFSCSYYNTTDQIVYEGPESTDEMCMMAAVYYPDQGFLRCGD